MPQNNESNFYEFPDLGDSSTSIEEAAYLPPAKNRRSSRDSIMSASGYVLDIRQHERTDLLCMYFVTVGIFSGSVPDESARGGWKPIFLNCDLLVGPSLYRWAEALYYSTLRANFFKKVRCDLTIRNLSFSPELFNDQPKLASRGILETLTFGGIN